MCVLKYDNNEDVLKKANDSNYGLGAGVVSEDPSELQYFINNFKAGTVYANCWNVFTAMTPFGGYKDSGIGRELGAAALRNYLETKTVIIQNANDTLP